VLAEEQFDAVSSKVAPLKVLVFYSPSVPINKPDSQQVVVPVPLVNFTPLLPKRHLKLDYTCSNIYKN
jgi:hypothetical protein